MIAVKRIMTIIAVFTLVLGFVSCGEDSGPVALDPIPEPHIPYIQERIDYPVASEIRGIVSEDLDGDGDLDLAVPMYDSDGFSVILNKGDGAFQPAVDISEHLFVALYPFLIVAGDFDGDGDIDIMTGNKDGSVSRFKNNGDASFSRWVRLTLYSEPKDMCLSDADGDGDLDLILIDAYKLTVLSNNGNATFDLLFECELADSPRSLCAADLDGDGDIDLAVTFQEWSYFCRGIATLLNNGDGTFQDAKMQGPEIWSLDWIIFGDIEAADLDGDGDNDIAVVGSDEFDINILLNDGNGEFSEGFISYDLSGAPHAISSFDLEGDGDIDLATINRSTSSISLLLNNGNGTFITLVDYAAGPDPYALVALDYDVDGDGDLAVANGGYTGRSSVSVFKNGARD